MLQPSRHSSEVRHSLVKSCSRGRHLSLPLPERKVNLYDVNCHCVRAAAIVNGLIPMLAGGLVTVRSGWGGGGGAFPVPCFLRVRMWMDRFLQVPFLIANTWKYVYFYALHMEAVFLLETSYHGYPCGRSNLVRH